MEAGLGVRGRGGSGREECGMQGGLHETRGRAEESLGSRVEGGREPVEGNDGDVDREAAGCEIKIRLRRGG